MKKILLALLFISSLAYSQTTIMRYQPPGTTTWVSYTVSDSVGVGTVTNSTTPIKVKAFATGSLPTAASYPYNLAYDLTTSQLKFSNGTIWQPLGSYTGGTTAFPSLTGNSGKFLTNDGASSVSWVAAGAGSVTSVSVASANGVSGSVATATTTPAITLTLGAITPSSVAASGTVTGSNLSGTNTGDQTTVSGNAGTATTLQNARLVNGISFNGSADINVDITTAAYAALGSPILAQTVGQPVDYANTSTALVDGQIKFTAVYLPKAATLTGIKVYVRVLGSYTGDNNNRVGLYTYSGGNLTLVASSANNASLWTSAANAIQTIPFSGTYSAAAGLYFVGLLYNQSAQTTAPSLASGVALNNLAMSSTALGFTNSAKLHGTANGTDLTTPIAMSAITASVIPSWVALY